MEELPATPVTENQLKSISLLADELIKRDQRIKDMEETLEKAKKARKYIAEVELPQMLGEVKMQSFTLDNGFKITLKPLFVVNYYKDKIDLVEEWLDENGHGGMVKNVITISLPKGIQDELIAELRIDLEDYYKLEYKEGKTINWQTLNAWGREMEREERQIPEELFSVYRSMTAVVEA